MLGPQTLARSKKRTTGGATQFQEGFGSTTAASYPHRLNLYSTPPTMEITLDQFEQWAIDRLRVLGEIESCMYRNKTPAETEVILKPLLAKYLPLSSTKSTPPAVFSNAKLINPVAEERKKDHYSHFILRLAFARSDDLRRRFSRAETMLFRYRFQTDDSTERQVFIKGMNLDWQPVSEQEKNALRSKLAAATGLDAEQLQKESFFKVDWESVFDLVEQRKVFLNGGKAFVPYSLQQSLVLQEFTARLEKSLEQTARNLPRLDEDDRLIPILNHLSLGFTAPEFNTTSTVSTISGGVTAAQVDGLTKHFPLCMAHLHASLRKDKHLRHFGRLQYGLFIKGIGLTVEEAIIFWRTSFSNITDDKFNKDYRYNIRHSYGLEGNRRNYKPYSCQQILTEHPPGPGDAHGCPYRHFNVDNLPGALERLLGVTDRSVINGVKQDVADKKFHLGCNRVFEHLHAREIQREKENRAAGVGLETIIHPNEYFERSYKLKNPKGAMTDDSSQSQSQDVEMT